jgi:hypothetical protein
MASKPRETNYTGRWRLSEVSNNQNKTRTLSHQRTGAPSIELQYSTWQLLVNGPSNFSKLHADHTYAIQQSQFSICYSPKRWHKLISNAHRWFLVLPTQQAALC